MSSSTRIFAQDVMNVHLFTGTSKIRHGRDGNFSLSTGEIAKSSILYYNIQQIQDRKNRAYVRPGTVGSI